MVGRCLGIDFGERRIGLAISDERNRVAVPLVVLERRTDTAAVEEIRRMIERENVVHVIVGDPVGLDGTAGDAALRARSFARKLAQATERSVEMVPETLTSVEAERLREAPREQGGAKRHADRRMESTKKRSRHVAIDAVAAQILLQEVLDRHDRKTGGEDA